MRFRTIFVFVALVTVLSLLAAQCAAPPTPEKIIETVVVKEEVEKIVTKEVEVEKEVEVIVTKVVKVEKEVVVTVEVPVEVPAEAEPAEIVVVVAEEPPNLDWGYVGTSHLPVTRNTYETLTTRDGQTGELIPQLAESWERIDDYTWRIKLKEGINFQDGEPFNAEAVVWNLTTLSDPELDKHVFQSLNQQLFVEAVDEYTVDVKTEEPDPIIPRRLYWAHMGSPKAVQADPDFQTMVGTGPYLLDEWVHGERIVLVADPNYREGEPEVKKITFVWREESSVRSAMVQAGEADIAAWLAPQDAGPIRTLGADIPETPFLRMDPTGPMSDIRVRRAICMAIDQDAIAQKIFGGYAVPATQIITPDVMGYNPDIEPYPYDPEAARALIEEARADGVPVDAEINIIGRTGIYANSTENMEAFQAWLAEIGLNASLTMKDVSAWLEDVRDKPVPSERYGIIQISHGNEAGEGIFTLMGYYRSDSSHNSVEDAEMDELIAAAAPLMGDERQAALAKAFAYEHDEMIQDCPLVHMQGLYGLSGRINWVPRFDQLILGKEISMAY